MPELPEVELARKGLAKWLPRGTKLRSIHVQDARVVKPSAKALRDLEGAEVKSVERRGKWLRIVLRDGRRLFSHLGMTGEWARVKSDAPTERFERVRFEVEKGGTKNSVLYVDARMFGHVIAAKEDTASWKKLGTDPLVDGIDVDALAARLAKRKKAIKEVLLDQSLLAGVGNILAIESLWRAKVSPKKRASTLTPAQVKAIAKGVMDAIHATIAAQEGERASYVNAGGPNPFKVYGRKNEPCPRCKTPIARIVLGGRGTYFCPHCQAGK